jgi:hypothetical protein
MAFAYRQADMPRRVMIRLDERLARTTDIAISLVIGPAAYKVDAVAVGDRLIVVVNNYSTFEDALLRAGQADHIGVEVWDSAADERLLIEALTFHLSFFRGFFDFARETDIYTVRGDYPKAGSLAIFTHVYNDNTMLKIWENFYGRIVPARDLFVIDHGSDVSPRGIVSPDVNVVSMPRGSVDHRIMAQFCSTFQRFLLSQYRWVIHVDADELLVHAQGWDAFKESLRVRTDSAIIKPGHAYDLVHDVDKEPVLDLSAPLSRQRNRLVPAPIYAKPVLSSVPATWHIGFHLVFENHALIEDDDLWLIHLSYADLALHLEKSRKWDTVEIADIERSESPHLFDRPPATIERTKQIFLDLLLAGPTVNIPDWMRGMF